MDTHISGLSGNRRRRRPAICSGEKRLSVVLHELAQRQIGMKLGRLGATRALIGQRVRSRCPVVAAARIGVAGKLTRDRRRRPSQAPRDHSDRLTARARQRDLLAL